MYPSPQLSWSSLQLPHLKLLPTASTDPQQQLLWQHAQAIASTYPNDQRDQYVQAALTLRHPYWDWAVHPALPDVVAQPQIEINTATGWQTIENPLYQYNFQTDAAGSGFPLSHEVYSQWAPVKRDFHA
jgi:tyrosinase